ncbi:hypothetical protein LP419_40040 [Massilia sp. H-1]|nr:hypothetical protein LP419_40040 [Massilia sp. H-1]
MIVTTLSNQPLPEAIATLPKIASFAPVAKRRQVRRARAKIGTAANPLQAAVQRRFGA